MSIDPAVEAFLADPTSAPHPAADPDQAALLAWAHQHDIGRPTPEMSQGRYRMPSPAHKGQLRSRTRMSKLAGTLDDGTGLEVWRNRLIVTGLQANPHLLAAADVNDKASLSRAADTAAIHGGDMLRADLGTAMHTALENHLLGTGHRPPAPWDTDLDAIAECVARHRLECPPEWLEVVVHVPALDAAGRIDIIAHGPWGKRPRIVDLKTGDKLEYGLVTYAGQLAGYSMAEAIWTPDGYLPFPEVDPDVGILLHAPLGSGTCTAYELDLKEGRDIIGLCVKVRKRRNGAKKLAKPMEVPGALEEALAASVATQDAGGVVSAAPPEQVAGVDGTDEEVPVMDPGAADEPAVPTPATAPLAEVLRMADADDATRRDELIAMAGAHAQRTEWVVNRIRTIRDCGDPQPLAALQRFWPAGHAYTPPWTPTELDAIHAVVHAVEVADAVPFPPLDPTVPTSTEEFVAAKAAAAEQRAAADALNPLLWDTCDDGTPADPEDRGRLAATVTFLSDDQKRLAKDWECSATLGGRPWRFDPLATHRIACINEAALYCAANLDEETTRLALEAVFGLERLDPAWSTGALLGSLTVDQAHHLLAYATRIGEDDADTIADLGERFARHAATLAAPNTTKEISTP